MDSQPSLSSEEPSRKKEKTLCQDVIPRKCRDFSKTSIGVDLRSPLRHTQEYNETTRSHRRWSNSRRSALEDKFTPRNKEYGEERSSRVRRKISVKEEGEGSSSGDWYSQVKKSDELDHQIVEYQEKLDQYNRTRSRVSSTASGQSVTPQPLKMEDDLVVLMRREKQLEYGKNTIAYEAYINDVPKEKRSRFHPSTPDKFSKCSRRSWDSQVKIWRRALHDWKGFVKQQRAKRKAKGGYSATDGPLPNFTPEPDDSKQEMIEGGDVSDASSDCDLLALDGGWEDETAAETCDVNVEASNENE